MDLKEPGKKQVKFKNESMIRSASSCSYLGIESPNEHDSNDDTIEQKLDDSNVSAPKAVFVSDLINSALSIKSKANSVLFEDDIIYYKSDSPPSSAELQVNSNDNTTSLLTNQTALSLKSVNEQSVSGLIDSLFGNCLKLTNPIRKFRSITLAIVFVRAVHRKVREKKLLNSLPTIRFIDEDNLNNQNKEDDDFSCSPKSYDDSINLTPYVSRIDPKNIRKSASSYCIPFTFSNQTLRDKEESVDVEDNNEVEKRRITRFNQYQHNNNSIFSNYYNSISNTSNKHVKTPIKRLVFDSIDLNTPKSSLMKSSKSIPSNIGQLNDNDTSQENKNEISGSENGEKSNENEELGVIDKYKNSNYYYIKKSELRFIANNNELLNKQMTPQLITNLSKQQLNLENFSLKEVNTIHVDNIIYHTNTKTNKTGSIKEAISIQTIPHDDLIEFKLANSNCNNLNDLASRNFTIIDDEDGSSDNKKPVQNCIQNLIVIFKSIYSKIFDSNVKKNDNTIMQENPNSPKAIFS